MTCTERHDPTYAVSGLVYDVVICEELELASLLPLALPRTHRRW